MFLATDLLGFGFVEFEKEEVVEKVIQIHYHQIKSKTVCFFSLIIPGLTLWLLVLP